MRRLAGEALFLIAALAALRLWKALRAGRYRLGRTMGGNTGGREQGVAAFTGGALLVPCGLDRLGDFRVSVSLSFRGGVTFIGAMRDHGCLIPPSIQSSRPLPYSSMFWGRKPEVSF
jgi:hypothetical protein